MKERHIWVHAASVLLVFLQPAVVEATRHRAVVAAAPAPAPAQAPGAAPVAAPAAAPAAAPVPELATWTAAPTLEEPSQGAVQDIEMKFEILNYNYHDLEEEVFLQLSAGMVGDAASNMEGKAAGASAVAVGTTNYFGDALAATIASVLRQLIDDALHAKTKAGLSMGTETVAQAEEIVVPPDGLSQATMLNSLAASPSPAAASPSPAAAAGASGVVKGHHGPCADDLNIFVTFQPGQVFKEATKGAAFLQVGRAGGLARSTLVHVVITDKPLDGHMILPEVQGIIMKTQDLKLIRSRLRTALTKLTGVVPRFAADLLKSKPVAGEMKAFEEGDCEKHMKKVVAMLEEAYTRRMVPLALYNECTNFLPQLSFSHDAIASPLDRKKCRAATIRFAKRWNYGKEHWKYGGSEKEKMDFGAFCGDICKTRYGDNAPQCKVKDMAGKDP